MKRRADVVRPVPPEVHRRVGADDVVVGQDVAEAEGVAGLPRSTPWVDEVLADEREKALVEIRAVVREGYGDLFTWTERVSGVGPAELGRFFAKGMLLNVVAAMDLLNSDEPWARRLVDGCREQA